MPKQNKSADPQIKKFREAARRVEADEDESKFNDALRRVAKAPPDGALPKHPEKAKKPGQ